MPRPFLLSDTRPREERVRSIRERGVVLATVGLYVTLPVIYSLGVAGAASITTTQWFLAGAVTGLVQAVLSLMVRTGYDRRLRWDPHFAEVERVRRYGAQVGPAFIDVDHFKNYNDTIGRATGLAPPACRAAVRSALPEGGTGRW